MSHRLAHFVILLAFLANVEAHMTAVCTSTAASQCSQEKLIFWFGTYHNCPGSGSVPGTVYIKDPNGVTNSFSFSNFVTSYSTYGGKCMAEDLHSQAPDSVLPSDAVVTCYKLPPGTNANSNVKLIATNDQPGACQSFPGTSGSWGHSDCNYYATINNAPTGTYEVWTTGTDQNLDPCSNAEYPCQMTTSTSFKFDLSVASCGAGGQVVTCDDQVPPINNVVASSLTVCQGKFSGYICNPVCQSGYEANGYVLTCDSSGRWTAGFDCVATGQGVSGGASGGVLQNPYLPPPPPPAGPPTGKCSAECEHEFEVCEREGPGTQQCLAELIAFVGNLAKVCVKGCWIRSYMPPSPPSSCVNACSSACKDEFANCVAHGPGRSDCLAQITAGTGTLGGVCAAGCDLCETSPPSLPPLGSPCSAACALEFKNCIAHNGLQFCTDELANGATPAGPWSSHPTPMADVCLPGCTMQVAPPSPPAGPCVPSCVLEFANCLHNGPGLDGCNEELREGYGPLMDPKHGCVIGCTIVHLPPSPPVGPCSAACVAEYDNCVKYGPGATLCRGEIDQRFMPLGAVCVPYCTLPVHSSGDAEPRDTPTPPSGLCTKMCEEVFAHCVSNGNHVEPYKTCKDEITMSIPPLANFCARDCTFTAAMTAQQLSPSPPPLPSPPPPPPSSPPTPMGFTFSAGCDTKNTPSGTSMSCSGSKTCNAPQQFSKATGHPGIDWNGCANKCKEHTFSDGSKCLAFAYWPRGSHGYSECNVCKSAAVYTAWTPPFASGIYAWGAVPPPSPPPTGYTCPGGKSGTRCNCCADYAAQYGTTLVGGWAGVCGSGWCVHWASPAGCGSLNKCDCSTGANC